MVKTTTRAAACAALLLGLGQGCGEETTTVDNSTAPVGGGGTGGTAAGSGGVAASGGMSGGGGSVTGGGTTVTGPVCEGVTEVKEGQCKSQAEGVYAIKTKIDVWWGETGFETTLVDPGRGEITIYLIGELTEVCEDGSGGKGTIRACGAQIPTFVSSLACDAYQTSFADEIWDRWDTMPYFTTTGRTEGFSPGDVLTLDAATGLVGIDLMETDGEWPRTTLDPLTFGAGFVCPGGEGAGCFPDHDGDGKPGITATLRDDGAEHRPDGCGGFNAPFHFRASPLTLDPLAGGGIGGGERIDTLYLGMRTNIGGSGAIGPDCASGNGASQSKYIDSRAGGCFKRAADAPGTPSAECTAADLAFVDGQLPRFRTLGAGEVPGIDGLGAASEGAKSALIRLGDLGDAGGFGGFKCAEVRGQDWSSLLP